MSFGIHLGCKLELCGSISPHGPVALRPRFGRARSRGFDLSQRRAFLRGLFGHVAARPGGCLARGYGASAESRGALQLVLSVLGDTLLVVPPRSLWPPPESTKIRYKGAHFVPLAVIQALLSDQAIDEDRWAVDGESECLIPSGSHGRGPFRVALRSSAGVDRLQHAASRSIPRRVSNLPRCRALDHRSIRR
jgi:hypothetical protein